MKETEKFAPPTETAADSTPIAIANELAEARKNLLAGAAWCLGGLAFSFGSYYFTQAGGRYFVATGAVIWGAVQAGKGLLSWMQIQRRNGRFAALTGMAAAAACGLAAVVCLLLLSSQLGSGSQAERLDEPQRYTLSEAGLRIVIPAGFTAFEVDRIAETDSTCAQHFLYTQDDLWEMNVTIVEGMLDGAERIEDILGFVRQRDSLFYTGGGVTPAHPTTCCGREMLCSEGRHKEHPARLFTRHHIRIGQSLVTATLVYPMELRGTAEALRRTGELLAGIESTSSGGAS
ncbi:hypothetical protein [Alistipes sp.]|uniref:hypothetical protein n=1 Tax=Alistipes sp. TaxID=1872444 RepID=UPI003AF04008